MDRPGWVFEDVAHSAGVPPFVDCHVGEEFWREAEGFVLECLCDDEVECFALLLCWDWCEWRCVSWVALEVSADVRAADPVCHHGDGLALHAERDEVAAACLCPALAVFNELVEDFGSVEVDELDLVLCVIEWV